MSGGYVNHGVLFEQMAGIYANRAAFKNEAISQRDIEKLTSTMQGMITAMGNVKTSDSQNGVIESMITEVMSIIKDKEEEASKKKIKDLFERLSEVWSFRHNLKTNIPDESTAANVTRLMQDMINALGESPSIPQQQVLAMFIEDVKKTIDVLEAKAMM